MNETTKDPSEPFDTYPEWLLCPSARCGALRQHTTRVQRAAEGNRVILSYSHECPMCHTRWRGKTIRATVESDGTESGYEEVK